MSSDPYSNRVRRLFAKPVHAGELVGGTQILVENQGVRIRLAAELVNGRISELRFLAWGCPHLIAAAEAFCEHYEGREPADLDAFAASDLMQTLAVPVEKTGRILVLEDAVRSLGHAVRDRS